MARVLGRGWSGVARVLVLAALDKLLGRFGVLTVINNKGFDAPPQFVWGETALRLDLKGGRTSGLEGSI
jgi:hypothetical protein